MTKLITITYTFTFSPILKTIPRCCRDSILELKMPKESLKPCRSLKSRWPQLS